VWRRQERTRYVPLGWTKPYEFSETDQRFALDAIDSWVGAVAQGRTHIAPDRIPWDTLRVLLSDTNYGGRCGTRARECVPEGADVVAGSTTSTTSRC
jgi:hypothetical protein